jgi:signal peptide peptidase SppA
MKYSRILQALAMEPWAIQQEKLHAICEVIASRIIAGQPVDAKFTPAQDRRIASKKGAVGVVPISGVISNRMNMVDNMSGGASTELIGKQFRAMVKNDDIKTIILDVDSPGGTISGVPELHDTIMAARGVKPIIAHVNALAASAAYWLASAADEIVVTPSGMTGSVGVYILHENWSKFLENEGVEITGVFEGDHKLEGNFWSPLSEEAIEHLQERVKTAYDQFISAIAAGRGVDKKTILENYGQGRAFGAKESVKRGMADRIGTFEETLDRFGVTADGRKAKSPDPAPHSLDLYKRRARLSEIKNA